MTEEAAAFKLETALSMAATLFPNAAQVLAMMDVRLDARAQTAAVTSSGRMLVSPTFLDTLTVQQTVFVVAHELHHVMYGVFDRFDSNTSGSWAAFDYHQLKMVPPPGGMLILIW